MDASPAHSQSCMPLTRAEAMSSCTALVMHPQQSSKSGNHLDHMVIAQAYDRDGPENKCERHEYEIKAVQDQYHAEIQQLRIRAEGFEMDWKRLDARLIGLKSDVENIPLDLVPHFLTSDKSTQTEGSAEPQSPFLARVTIPQTPLINNPGPAAQRDSLGKAVIDELKEWHVTFDHPNGIIKQQSAANKDVQFTVNDHLTEIQGPLGCEIKYERQIEDLQEELDRSTAYAKRLEKDIKSHQGKNARQKTELQRLLELHSRNSSSLKREQVARETLIGAFARYQSTTALGSNCEAPSVGKREIPSICDAKERRSRQVHAPPIALPDKWTGPESSNKRKRDTSEVDSQLNDAFQPRKRMALSDQTMPRPDGSGRRDAGLPEVVVPRGPAGLWRALALNDPSTGRHRWARDSEISNTKDRLTAVQNLSPVLVPQRSALAAGQDVEAPSRNVGLTESLASVHQAGSSITVPIPAMVVPVERKWKHSMLRRG